MVAVMTRGGMPDLEHVKKWATRSRLASRETKWADLAVLSMEKKWWRGNGEHTITLSYNEGLCGENVTSNSCKRSKCEQDRIAD